MFDNNEIMKRLREGADPEELAKEMADALNAATTAFKEEEAARSEEESKRQTKILVAQDILDAIARYLSICGEDDLVDAIAETNVEDFVRIIDSTIELSSRLEDLKSLEFPLFGIWN